MFDLRRIAVIIHDTLMVIIAWLLAAMVRVGFQANALDANVWHAIPLILLAQTPIFWYYGLYRSIWRFASLPDLTHITKSSIIGTLAISSTLFFFNYLHFIPRTALVLYPLFLVFLLGMPRLLYRLWKENSLRYVLDSRSPKRTLIIGAGRAGEMLVRDILRDGEYLLVGLVDDNEKLHGAKLHGVPILQGTIDRLPALVRKFNVQRLIIALPSASDAQMRRIVDYCEQSQIPFLTLPKLDESPKTSISELHQVSLDDLLGREKVKLDLGLIEERLKGKSVLVSGGGGSIGGELCRQIASLKPEKLIILERCEFNLYQIEQSLQKVSPETHLYIYLGDVGDEVRVKQILNIHRPNVIFHAAAYKHVPLLQHQIRETAKNNILGTQTFAELAVEFQVQSFVLISTDKAVNPTNIMGASKRIAELFCQALNERSKTRFITVRFGNVLDSAGSVVPLFRQQILNGGPVTVTHPEITRYFMTIPEACQLILQAGAMGYGGEIFVLDMGSPIKIRYLAEQLIRLSGKTLNHDIQIIYTGLRAGEKLHEELFHSEEEQMSRTRHSKIMLAASRSAEWGHLIKHLNQLKEVIEKHDEKEIYHLLKTLAPEFHENNISI
jgi:FlaA1/EpsC-like NDP-sugar epimerase